MEVSEQKSRHSRMFAVFNYILSHTCLCLGCAYPLKKFSDDKLWSIDIAEGIKFKILNKKNLVTDSIFHSGNFTSLYSIKKK